jgi:hypothetical protein
VEGGHLFPDGREKERLPGVRGKSGRKALMRRKKHVYY